MKLFLVIASVAMMCLVECSAQDLLESSYDGGYSYGGVPSYAAPSYAVSSYGGLPSYGGVPNYGGVPSYGGIPSYGGVPSYGVSSGYSGLASFGLTGMMRGSDVGPGIPCMCAPSPPKICGSDFITYQGWCNFKCGVINKPELKLAYMGECKYMARIDNQRDNNN